MTREEAINIIRDTYHTDTELEALTVLVPELKESEDERIRKGMIRFLNSETAEGIFTYEARQSWIAYLEKLKAAETPQWMIDFLKDIRTASINKEGYDDYDGRREYEGKILAIIRWLEGNFIQRKEQKPAEFDEYKIIKKHITEDMLSSEVNKRLTECGWYVTDEKPAEFKAGAEWMKKEFSSILDKWEEHAIRGMKEGASAYHQGKIALICDLRDWMKEIEKEDV